MNQLSQLTKRLESLIVSERNALVQQTDTVKIIQGAFTLAAQAYLYTYLRQLEQVGAELKVPEEHHKAFNIGSEG